MQCITLHTKLCCNQLEQTRYTLAKEMTQTMAYVVSIQACQVKEEILLLLSCCFFGKHACYTTCSTHYTHYTHYTLLNTQPYTHTTHTGASLVSDGFAKGNAYYFNYHHSAADTITALNYDCNPSNDETKHRELKTTTALPPNKKKTTKTKQSVVVIYFYLFWLLSIQLN